MKPVQLQCPVCKAPAGELVSPGDAVCSSCGFRMRRSDGILHALPPDREAYYQRFLSEYGAIRQAEGRGSEDPEFYRALPFEDRSKKNPGQWQIRARSFRYFESRLLGGAEDIADLGAGNCWLSHRLAVAGRRPVAVDLSTGCFDGLGAARHYPVEFPLVQAEFDTLPFTDGQFDLVVFNASLHYSTCYRRTLAEAARCLRHGGRIVVLDSPLYRLREHGELMRAERHAQFLAQYGFASDALPSQEFLYETLLAELSHDLRLRWTLYQPWYGWRWHIRPLRARWKRLRPPSRFCVLVAQPQTV